MKKIILPASPRQLRALKALSATEVSRHDLDGIAGAENSPEIVSQLKNKGFGIECKRAPMPDRDGRIVYPGIYFFADDKERQAVKLAFTELEKKEGGND